MPDNYSIRDAGSYLLQFASKLIDGVHFAKHIRYDEYGNPVNPNAVKSIEHTPRKTVSCDDISGFTEGQVLTRPTGVMFDQDTADYNMALIQVVTINGATVVVDQAIDGSSGYGASPYLPMVASAGANFSTSTDITATGFHMVPIFGNKISARVSKFGTGAVSIRAILIHKDQPISMMVSAIGPRNHSSPAAGGPVIGGGVVLTALDNTLLAGDASRLTMSKSAQAIVRQNAVRDICGQYAAPSGGIVNVTTAFEIAPAPGAGFRNVVHNMALSAEALGNATEFVVREASGGTVLFRTKIGTGGQPLTPIPGEIWGGSDKAIEVATLTASGTGAVYFNCDFYKELI